MKLLNVIKALQNETPMRIIPTFLGAHDFPFDYKDDREKYIDLICNEMIPAVAKENLAIFCDAFVDSGYYTLEQGDENIRDRTKTWTKD